MIKLISKVILIRNRENTMNRGHNAALRDERSYHSLASVLNPQHSMDRKIGE